MKRIIRRIAVLGMIGCLFLGVGKTIYAEQYEYDELNRLIKVTYDDGSYLEYSYDVNGNILEVDVYDASPEEPEKPEDDESSQGQENPSGSEESEGDLTGDDTGKGDSEQGSSGQTGSEQENPSSESSEEAENTGNETNKEEKSIIERVVDAVVNFIDKAIKWFKRWF